MARFTTLEGYSWELSKGSFDEPIIAIFTDDGDRYPIAHLDTSIYSSQEVEANARLLLHSVDMYDMLLKIITRKKCIVAEVRELLNKIDGDDNEGAFSDGDDNSEK